MKMNKKNNIKLKKIKVAKLTNLNISKVKGGDEKGTLCSNVGGILSLPNGATDDLCKL
ncbi:hypothetical protein ATE84_0216 [Aquimarina sp. MAR_2010_214]|uniref:hypothetical protein n=1 Tax=Aquimarina sp. MAR_2010_214 TaxID=1250026 RepID=UPI000CCB5E17|nr:hypothetical protein [Aquimarina sp. MAR_2010_214]PKV48223.1 hypothetical protein ATE84_0216 [Aquimarina sp. MAR_2010_214]